jgi:predicted RNase H-like HicB family nuclease
MYKEVDSDFSVSFPDFPGCITAGTTLEDAWKMAAEALAFHVDGMRSGGEQIPEPSSIEAIKAAPENDGALAFLVEVPDPPGRSQRINVTLPEDLIQAIDRTTKNRSRFLAEAARERLARVKA